MTEEKRGRPVGSTHAPTEKPKTIIKIVNGEKIYESYHKHTLKNGNVVYHKNFKRYTPKKRVSNKKIKDRMKEKKEMREKIISIREKLKLSNINLLKSQEVRQIALILSI